MPKMNESPKFSNVLQNNNQSVCIISTSRDVPCSQPGPINSGQSSCNSTILAKVEKTISVTLTPHNNRVSSLLNPSITTSSATISNFNGDRTVPTKKEQSTTLVLNCSKQPSVPDECRLPSSALCSPMPTCSSTPLTPVKVSAITPEKLACPSQPSIVNSYSPTLAKATLKRRSDTDDHLLIKQWKSESSIN